MGLEGALRVWGKAADGPARHPHAIRAARPAHKHGTVAASRWLLAPLLCVPYMDVPADSLLGA